MCFSPRQYENRDQWNQREAEYNWVPQPFDEEREIDWTPVWSLTEERWKYIPTAYCYFAYPYDANHDFCRADSKAATPPAVHSGKPSFRVFWKLWNGTPSRRGGTTGLRDQLSTS